MKGLQKPWPTSGAKKYLWYAPGRYLLTTGYKKDSKGKPIDENKTYTMEYIKGKVVIKVQK